MNIVLSGYFRVAWYNVTVRQYIDNLSEDEYKVQGVNTYVRTYWIAI